LYDTTTWYWDSLFYRSVYRRSYSVLFDKLDRRGWLQERGAPLRVVDCGIGTGLLTTSLIGSVDRRLDLFGIDTSPGMLEHARARLRHAGAEPRLMLADICDLPFQDREMGLVMAALVLEHVPNPADALREMVRIAGANATVVLIATRQGAPDWPFRLWFRYHPFAKDQVVRWMTEAGIRNVCVEPLSGVARPFARAYIGAVSGK
jgi:demethylmenaquinone methyltransferase/2-methoxy-6-polyprenyl-1,4-benzoquinol methylase